MPRAPQLQNLPRGQWVRERAGVHRKQGAKTLVKTCSVCKETKPWASFYRDAHLKGGLRSQCKGCTIQGKHRQEDFICNGCGLSFQATVWRRTASRYCSLRCWHGARSASRKPRSRSITARALIACRYCHSPFNGTPGRRFCSRECSKVHFLALANAAYRARPEHERRDIRMRRCPICDKDFLARHGRRRYCERCKKTSMVYLHALLVERDGNRCHICHKRVAGRERSADHLIPRSQGGSDDPINLRLAHRRCNSRRSDGRIPAQLLLALPRQDFGSVGQAGARAHTERVRPRKSNGAGHPR